MQWAKVDWILWRKITRSRETNTIQFHISSRKTRLFFQITCLCLFVKFAEIFHQQNRRQIQYHDDTIYGEKMLFQVEKIPLCFSPYDPENRDNGNFILVLKSYRGEDECSKKNCAMSMMMNNVECSHTQNKILIMLSEKKIIFSSFFPLLSIIIWCAIFLTQSTFFFLLCSVSNIVAVSHIQI